MNLEELDGFFSALIAGPEPVMPSEYNREVFGGEMSEVVEFSNLDEAREVFNLQQMFSKPFAVAPLEIVVHRLLVPFDRANLTVDHLWQTRFNVVAQPANDKA